MKKPMTGPRRRQTAPKPLKKPSAADSISVQGIDLLWSSADGTFTFQGLPAAMMWVDSTLAGLMSGLAAMVGPERFSLALQSEGRKSVESDWLLIASYPDFRSGFEAIGVTAAVAGWGRWELVKDDPVRRECRFRAYNTWEGLYQRTLETAWGSAMLAGKFAGYCTKRFGTNCWATQTAFIARGDPCDEFTVAPSNRRIEDEIEQLLDTDRATRADMAVALSQLREAQSQLLSGRETLEHRIRQRTMELTAHLEQLRSANRDLQAEVARNRATEDSRKQAESLLRSIIAIAPMSMAIVGMDGKIEYINQKSIETFGYLPEDIPDMDSWWARAYPDETYRQEVIQRWTGYLTAAVAGARDIQRDTYRVTCKDGTIKTVAAFGIPVAGKVFVMFDDVTEQANRESVFIRSRAELEGIVRARTAELEERNRALNIRTEERRQAEDQLRHSNLALERTAKQLRKLGVKLARVEEQERERMAHILHDQLQQSLVAASFSLSTLEDGLVDKGMRKTARAAAAALNEAIRESKSLVLELHPPVLREGGLAPALRWLRLRMREKHGLSVQVRVDRSADRIPEELRSAIFHSVRELLLNVAKHSGVTSAEVEVRLPPDRNVRVVVADTGRGYSTATPSAEGEPAEGFGMLAVRERMDALGGRMTVDSAPGKGCRVTLVAPIVEAPAAGADRPRPARRGKQAGAGAPPPAHRAKISVLLVDDHAMLRQGLAEHLTRDPQIDVIGEASDGEIAVEKARSLRPDVVLMDVSMPRMNGVEAARIIHAEFPNMVIIALSMYAEPHRAEEMRQAGAKAYVSKSEAAEALVATIHACCDR